MRSKKWSVTFELKTPLSHKEKGRFRGLEGTAIPKKVFLSSLSLYTMSYTDETHILDFALTKAFLPFVLRLQGTKRD